jgi:hypothetical protein
VLEGPRPLPLRGRGDRMQVGRRVI